MGGGHGKVTVRSRWVAGSASYSSSFFFVFVLRDMGILADGGLHSRSVGPGQGLDLKGEVVSAHWLLGYPYPSLASIDGVFCFFPLRPGIEIGLG